MRAITNRANLPAPLYNALAADTYVGGGDISVTRVIAPPRIVALRRYHEDEIVEDAADRIWSLLGSSVHRMLELSASNEVRVETRLSMPIQGIATEDGPLTWQMTGQPDLIVPATGAIYDYKVTSVWSVLFGDKPEWEAQLNLQAMLHRHNKDVVNQLFIIALMRDWQVRKARFEKDYPAEAAKVISFPLWSQSEAIDYTIQRIKLHQQAQLDYRESGYDANSLPLCTDKERWLRGATYSVKFQNAKTGVINKNAKRNFSTKPAAEQYMRDSADVLPKGKVWAPIQFKEGENIRCKDYCDVAKFCPFYHKLVEKERADRDASLVNETEEDGE